MGEFDARPADSFNFKEIIYEKKDWVAKVTINRPQAYNAMNTGVLAEMCQAFQDASYDDAVAVLVLTASGDKAFSTGGDVKEYAEDIVTVPRNYWKWFTFFDRAINLLINLGKPTIARLNGMVVGGGNEFHMACDLSIAADHVKIRQVGPSVGSVPAAGATQWLPIIIGDRRAREMLMLNEWIDAKKALEWGLVNQVAPYAELDNAVNDMCQKLINKFPECMRYTREQTNFWKNFAWHMTIGHARDWISVHYASVEPYEGMNAFVEKRPIDYLKLRNLAAQGKSSEFLWGPYKQKCPNCDAKGIPEYFKFCGNCGSKLSD